jgi:hypothetical protein
MGDHKSDKAGATRLAAPPFVPQPPAFHKHAAGHTVKTSVSPPSDCLVSYRLGQQGSSILCCQRKMNLLMDGGPLFSKWRNQSGNPWPRLCENGILDLDTQEALKYYQMLWGLWPSGDLCMLTRTLLNPFLKFRGTLQLRRPAWCFCGRGASMGGFQQVPGKFPAVNGGPRTSPSAPPPPPAPPSSPASTGASNDDKPWVPQLKLNYGFGVTKPLWVGKSRSGAPAPGTASNAEVDQKLEFDVDVPTSVAIGKGHLTLSLQAEYDSPIDPTHRGRPSATGTFELSGDDSIRLGKSATLSPFIDFSVQDQKGLVSGIVKTGLELKLDIRKNFALKADLNAAVQKGFSGLDPKTDPKLVIPVEGNARLEIQFP